MVNAEILTVTVMLNNDELECVQSAPSPGFDNNPLNSSAENMLSKVLFLFKFLDTCYYVIQNRIEEGKEVTNQSALKYQLTVQIKFDERKILVCQRVRRFHLKIWAKLNSLIAR